LTKAYRDKTEGYIKYSGLSSEEIAKAKKHNLEVMKNVGEYYSIVLGD